jgi:hypothetical protein
MQMRVELGVFRRGASRDGDVACESQPCKGSRRPRKDKPEARPHAHPRKMRGTYAVKRRSASRYFSEVFAITSDGRCGAGGVLSQSSVSR